MGATTAQLDIDKIRKEFPILNQEIEGHPLVYLDNAATTQKPKQVIKAVSEYYEQYNANIHRGIHTLAEKATHAFENTRELLKHFINAAEKEEIIFTRGTTESINLVASSWGRKNLGEGDEVIISNLEHHSNIVPWQMICEATGAILKVIPVNDQGELIMEEYDKLLSSKTKMVAVNHASNSLGTVNPIKEIIAKAHEYGAVVLIDGAQAGAHLPIDVQAFDADFYALSAHKFYGPTGAGALYGKRKLLEDMPPYMGGGEMIKDVSYEGTTYNDIPYKFEAGTPNIADVIAFGEAVKFLNDNSKEAFAKYEHDLIKYAHERLDTIKGITPVGTAANKVSIYSFKVENVHHFDIGQMLDARGIAVRTGHHCTQPLMDRLGIEGTVRASFAVYNTKEEIDKLAEGLEKILKFFRNK
ncbi:MAG: aminotransferase class V-fold PLP-dependent enzyme [Candidatus Cyclobacteriaceae bacterium M2_1C_046]